MNKTLRKSEIGFQREATTTADVENEVMCPEEKKAVIDPNKPCYYHQPMAKTKI